MKSEETDQLNGRNRDNALFHLVTASQLSREVIEMLAERADSLREQAAEDNGLRQINSLLSHKRAGLLFSQPSTRTFFSFMNACYILGMSVSEARDPSITSSRKGESFEDTVRTMAAYTDILIIRNREDDSAERAADTLDRFEKRIPVVNGGSGTREHPTQALLDVYTMLREFSHRGGVDGKKIVMAGDLRRGRTVRSLCSLLAGFADVEIYFAAVPRYQMKDDIRSFLSEHGVAFSNVDNFRDILCEADAVYMTRVQDEHDTAGESKHIDFSAFHMKTEYLDIMKKDAIIMHPLPRREEIPTEIDADPRAAYWRQEENGLWIRTALIASIMNV